MTAAHLKKLDDRSQQMVYLGVEDGCKAHRLFDPRRGKIFVSRDVIFEEKVQWNWCAGEVGNEPAEFTVEDDDWVNPSSWAMASGPAGAPGMAPAMSTSPSVVTAAHMEQEEQVSTPPATPASQPFLEQNALESPRSGNSEEGPIRYRNLEDIYQNTSEVELAYGSDGEALLAEMEEPSCYSEAAGYPEWEKAMNREIESIEKNGTWTLTTLPAGHKPIGLKWVYKLKKNSEGEVIKHKARLVAKGYVQWQGIDFEEVFALVARLDTVRMILAVAANRGWEVHHLDVKSAFLNGELEEEVYVSQPEGYTVKNKEHLVLRLSKALYGLRQAPRAWNIRLDKSLKNLGFRRCVQEQAVYTRGEGRAAVVIGVYVDDLIVTGDDPMQIQAFKQQMTKQFEMSDLGLLSYYLGIEVSQQERCLTLKQTGYAVKVITQFGMMDCNPTKYPMEQRAQLHKDPDGQLVDATEYRRVIGCLRYLLHTRPDLSFAVGVASRFMEKPTVMHYKAVKQILRYLKGTIHFGLVYSRGGAEEVITGFTDSDLAGDMDDRKSTSGMAFYINGSLVSWCSQKQKTVALSSCEAEFMAATAAACQALWLRSVLSELTGGEPGVVKLYVDNKSAIALMKNPVFHGRSKHIDTKYHFIRECIDEGQIAVQFVCTEEQRAYALTKALPAAKLAIMRHQLGVRDLGSHQD